MKFFYFFILTLTFTAISCNSDTDFPTEETDCQIVEISDGNKTVVLEKDTAWFVKSGEKKLFYCDKHKISAFFNTLRDLQLQGLSSYNGETGFKNIITIKKQSGKTVKTLKFNPVGNSPQLIGSCNGGKCYVVAVPGLKENPSVNFSPEKNYWKELSLLEISGENFSSIKVENFLDTIQSFSIVLKDGLLEFFDYKNEKNQEIKQENLREYIGSIIGIYRAKEQFSALQLPENNKIYSLTVNGKKIDFFKKIDNGKPDFNLMYFSCGEDFGTATYFNFEKILIDAEKLK
ncbi:MAG: hypothetical protein IKO99_13320 [Bacteroidales bacterium]|nr:hypothetical protein [Bacteroidales bacterium]